MPAVLLDSPSFTLYHDQENEWLHLEWRGPHTQQSVEHYCGALLQAVRDTKCRKILDDASEILDGWGELAQWLGRSFLPLLAQEGVTQLAILNAMDWPARLCLQAMLLHTEQPSVRLFDFDEMPAAQAWLRAG
ncbi:STAS/SEC14 domain-containing protein [Hymenobacter sp. HSC-4F20]|uniref:STAS/SEC14 domain-containing protein n=1 Tax=Hymenobacter sp. HSC-4F20 TaxID=2864135 RepID=UPI001C73B28B|nr:STAS/SEC14 domain-containing protein [Hymenobacter sp. HSC-4F20]MBX0289309.1 STAS/SEC14 domain-containing protein [Hymenobacter sp. HSC-4F20]